MRGFSHSGFVWNPWHLGISGYLGDILEGVGEVKTESDAGEARESKFKTKAVEL